MSKFTDSPKQFEFVLIILIIPILLSFTIFNSFLTIKHFKEKKNRNLFISLAIGSLLMFLGLCIQYRYIPQWYYPNWFLLILSCILVGVSTFIYCMKTSLFSVSSKIPSNKNWPTNLIIFFCLGSILITIVHARWKLSNKYLIRGCP